MQEEKQRRSEAGGLRRGPEWEGNLEGDFTETNSRGILWHE